MLKAISAACSGKMYTIFGYNFCKCRLIFKRVSEYFSIIHCVPKNTYTIFLINVHNSFSDRLGSECFNKVVQLSRLTTPHMHSDATLPCEILLTAENKQQF